MNVFSPEETESRVKETIRNKMTDALNDGIMMGIEEVQIAINEYYKIKDEEGLKPFIGKDEFNVFIERYLETRKEKIEQQKIEYRP